MRCANPAAMRDPITLGFRRSPTSHGFAIVLDPERPKTALRRSWRIEAAPGRGASPTPPLPLVVSNQGRSVNESAI